MFNVCSKNGIFILSICIPNDTTIIAAIVCPINLTIAGRPFTSSIKQKTARTIIPNNSPINL